MNIKAACFALLIFVMVPARLSLAQTSSGEELAQLQGQLISSWLVSVDGDPRQRAMKIQSVSPKAEGGFVLDITFGFVDQGQGPLKAELVDQGQGRTIMFTTRAGGKVSAVPTGSDSLRGTFTYANGVAKAMTMTRISEDDLRLKTVGVAAERMAQPGPDVPESCARFFGGWTGHWSWGMNEHRAIQLRLWVLGIKADCTAKVSLSDSRGFDVPNSFFDTDIKQGVLALRCGDIGRCTFELHGEELWVRYRDPRGEGFNHAVLQRIK